MRLWHKDLIQILPRQQLLGQWRECCAIAASLRDKGTPNHVLVNQILDFPIDHFWEYSAGVCEELVRRHYNCSWSTFENAMGDIWHYPRVSYADLFKGWHNGRYLRQCLYNLQEKADCGAIPNHEWELITDRWPWFE